MPKATTNSFNQLCAAESVLEDTRFTFTCDTMTSYGRAQPQGPAYCENAPVLEVDIISTGNCVQHAPRTPFHLTSEMSIPAS